MDQSDSWESDNIWMTKIKLNIVLTKHSGTTVLQCWHKMYTFLCLALPLFVAVDQLSISLSWLMWNNTGILLIAYLPSKHWESYLMYKNICYIWQVDHNFAFFFQLSNEYNVKYFPNATHHIFSCETLLSTSTPNERHWWCWVPQPATALTGMWK